MFMDSAKVVPGRANLVTVDAFETVETILPRIVGNRSRFSLAATREDLIRNAEVMTDLCDYQQERMQSEMKAQDMGREILKFGKGLTMLGWKHAVKTMKSEEVVKRPQENPDGTVTGDFKKETVTEDVIYDDPWEEFLSIWQVYTDPYIQNTEDQHSFITVRVKRKSWVVEKIGEKVFSADKTRLDAGNAANDEANKGMKDKIESAGLRFTFEDDADDPFGLVFERWSKDRVITTWNNTVQLRDKSNPFRHAQVPLLDSDFVRVPGCWYGKGVIECMESHIQELTSHRNNMMDDSNARAHHMWKRRRGSKIDEQQLLSRPDGIIDVNQMSDIEPLQRSPADPASVQLVQMLQGDLKRASGQNEFTGGQMPTKRMTQGEVSTVMESVASRLDMALSTFETMYVKRKGLLMYKMNQQFLIGEKTYRVTGKMADIKTVSANEIQGDFDVRPIAGASKAVNRGIRRKEMLEFMQINSGKPWFNEALFAADLLKDTYDFADGDKYINAAMRPRQSAEESKLGASAENLTFLRAGFIGDPLMEEDHAIHNLEHEKVVSNPLYARLPQNIQQKLILHVMKHDDFLKKESPGQPPAGSTPLPNGGPGAPNPGLADALGGGGAPEAPNPMMEALA